LSEEIGKKELKDERPAKLLASYVAVPLAKPLAIAKKFFEEAYAGNKIDEFRKMFELDADLRSAITQIAIVCASAFKGVAITGEGEVGEGEKKVLAAAQAFFEGMHVETYLDDPSTVTPLRSHIFTTAEDVMKYGDSILQIASEAKLGVTAITHLPNERITRVEAKKDYGVVDASKIYSKGDIYVLDENASLARTKDTTAEPQPFDKEQIVHIDWNLNNSFTTDILGRMTQGLWSVSPLESLKLLLMWKMNTIHNDLLWRDRMVPRYHHRLDLSAFDPNLYPGTGTQQIAAAKKDAQAAIDEYNKQVAEGTPQNPLQPDQGFTTGREVEVLVVEPKSTTYASPNEVLNQINESEYNGIGVPAPTIKSFAAIYMASEFLILRGQYLAEKIASKFNWILHRHLYLQGYNSIAVKRIRLIVNFILERNMTEKARQIAILSQSKTMSSTELRQLLGKGPLTDADKQELGLLGVPTEIPGRPFGADTGAAIVEKTRSQPGKEQPGVKYPSQIEEDHTSRGGPGSEAK